tara:strand:- start:1817 stop:2371 length:555 start_codon:yes stop_codon:yes gene_type:complete
MKKLILILIAFTATTFAEYPTAVRIIKNFEGFSAKAYADKDQKAIGYGTELRRAMRAGFSGTVITKMEATEILLKCIKENVPYIKSKIPNFDSLPETVQGALLSAAYNSYSLIGPKLCKYINNEQYAEACIELAYGHKGELYGLVKRRFFEARQMALGFKVKLDFRLDVPIKGEFELLKKQYYR